MNNFSLRVVFGALYVAIWVLGIQGGEIVFTAVMALFMFLSLNECYKNFCKEDNSSIATAVLYVAITVFLALYNDTKHLEGEYIFALLLQLIAIGGIRYFMNEHQVVNKTLSTLYIWLPLASLTLYYNQHLETAGPHILFFLIIVWLYDSLAYLTGKQFGEKAIFPTTSPKKTWEGTIGGLVLTLLAVYFLSSLEYFSFPPKIILVAAIVIVSGIAGDYVQSFVKRKLGLKDSGNVIPGHGGILDRLDSILLSALPFLVAVNMLGI